MHMHDDVHMAVLSTLSCDESAGLVYMACKLGSLHRQMMMTPASQDRVLSLPTHLTSDARALIRQADCLQ